MPQLTVKIATAIDLADVYAIRTAVFQVEQGVAAELEFDGYDAAATHLIARLNEQPVGTARLRKLSDRTAKLERVAVLANYRGHGIGRQIVATALTILTDQQIPTVIIHAQLAVRSLYEFLGFIAQGDEFVEAGIRHIKMVKVFEAEA